MNTAHIYVRVSTNDQDLSPEWQRQVCQRYFETTLAHRGYALNPVVYEDRQSAFCKAWADRDAGRELFKLVKPGDVIVAAKQDRVWRSVRDRENSMFFLASMGIEIVLLDANIDTTTAAGRFAAGILALQAQWESDVRSERMKAARVIRRQRKTPERFRPPPGWYWCKATEQFLPDIGERKLLLKIHEWREKNVRGIKATCRFLEQEGIRRRNGALYSHRFVIRSWQCIRRDWPLEGYLFANPLEDRMRQRKGRSRAQCKPQPFSRAEIAWIFSVAPNSSARSDEPDATAGQSPGANL